MTGVVAASCPQICCPLARLLPDPLSVKRCCICMLFLAWGAPRVFPRFFEKTPCGHSNAYSGVICGHFSIRQLFEMVKDTKLEFESVIASSIKLLRHWCLICMFRDRQRRGPLLSHRVGVDIAMGKPIARYHSLLCSDHRSS